MILNKRKRASVGQFNWRYFAQQVPIEYFIFIVNLLAYTRNSNINRLYY